MGIAIDNKCQCCGNVFDEKKQYCPKCGVDTDTIPLKAEGVLMLRDTLDLDYYIYNIRRVLNFFLEEEFKEFEWDNVRFTMIIGNKLKFVSEVGMLCFKEGHWIVGKTDISDLLFENTDEFMYLTIYRCNPRITKYITVEA